MTLPTELNLEEKLGKSVRQFTPSLDHVRIDYHVMFEHFRD